MIRLVRAKQATKRKSSLDTLIEVVQKELLRVNGQSTSTSPTSSPPHYSQTRSSTSFNASKPAQHRSTMSSVLPSQGNHSFKPTRKRANQHSTQAKRAPSNRHRHKSFNHHDDLIDDVDLTDDGDDDDEGDDEPKANDAEHPSSKEYIDEMQSSAESIDDVVRDTVDKLVAITLLNNAPFIVNMLTALPGNGAEAKQAANIPVQNTSPARPPPPVSTEYYRNDLALLSSTASDIRNSMQQASPVKQQHLSAETSKPSTPTTVFVAPRLLNFQTVVPKPTTNLQLGSTKIILVSPSGQSQQQQQHASLANQNPIKLVKFAPSSHSSTLALSKNVHLVLPSRPSNDAHNSTYRPLAGCSTDQIPQAAQEVTITSSPPSNINKPRRRSSTSTPTDKPVGKILRPIAKVLPVYSPNNSNHGSSRHSHTLDDDLSPF